MTEKKKSKKKITIDHWGFLEEIEAPMWVDLSLESKYKYRDIDDHWFQVNHPFHEHSSCYLLFGLLNSGKDKELSDVDLIGLSSPKLPSSVSRSRGKHFKSRKLRGNEQQQIRKLNGETRKKISALGGSRILRPELTGDETSMTNIRSNSIHIKKCKIQNPRHTSSWRPSFVGKSSSNETMKSSSSGESTLTSNSGPDSSGENCGIVRSRSSSTKLLNCIRKKSSFGDSSGSLSEGATIVGESFLNSKVNNVANSGLQEIKIIDPPKESLSAFSISLNKTRVTRRSSYGEVKDKRQLQGLKSSLGNSNIGFFSISGCNIKKSLVTSGVNQGRYNEDKNLNKLDKPTQQNNGKGRNASKTSRSPQKELFLRSKPEGKTANVKCVNKETTKAKVVLHHFDSRKPSLQQKVQDPSVAQSKAKGIVINKNQGKAREWAVSSWHAEEKENIIENIGSRQKHLKQRLEVKNEKGLSNPKVKANVRSKLENPTRTIERIYFR